jgi:hypothetical protein
MYVYCIYIHKADKNNVTVIQNLSDYLMEADRQLNDNVHYEQIDEVNLENTEAKVNEIINKMQNESCIEESLYRNVMDH